MRDNLTIFSLLSVFVKNAEEKAEEAVKKNAVISGKCKNSSARTKTALPRRD